MYKVSVYFFRNSGPQNSTQIGITLTVTVFVTTSPSSPVHRRVKTVWDSIVAVSTPFAPEEAAPWLTTTPFESVTEQVDATAWSRFQKRNVVSPSMISEGRASNGSMTCIAGAVTHVGEPDEQMSGAGQLVTEEVWQEASVC